MKLLSPSSIYILYLEKDKEGWMLRTSLKEREITYSERCEIEQNVHVVLVSRLDQPYFTCVEYTCDKCAHILVVDSCA